MASEQTYIMISKLKSKPRRMKVWHWLMTVTKLTDSLLPFSHGRA